MCDCSELSIDAAEHISDQLHKAALLLGKSKYNSHSDLSDYESSSSSLVKAPEHLTNQASHTLDQS